MIRFDGKVALVTGGSRGIGAAAARMFAEAGADVAISYLRNKAAAGAVVSDVERLGRRALAVAGDLSKEADAAALIDAVEKEFGRLDILVNNHGIWNDGPLETMSLETWDEMIEINLRAVFLVTQRAVPLIKRGGGGRIVLVSSTAGQRGEAFHSHYAASKGAIISLTKSWGPELAADNITVNCVAPGWVDTDMCTEVFSDTDYKEEVRRTIPIGRIPPPEDIAGPIVFLASDLARHITGEILNVNGGSVLCG
ncbi:MAG TPA: 3-oxoacyl-ACP reductase family protein [Acidobacteriota bacterium]|nr:3-oxoacyl-ACP reductase family protein [Acidobacteriota bacterium]